MGGVSWKSITKSASHLSPLVQLSLGGFLARMARFRFTERNKMARGMLNGKPEAAPNHQNSVEVI